MSKPTNEQIYYDVLKTIARGYMTPKEMERACQKGDTGLCYHEYLEMAFENVQGEAKAAIRGRKRP